MNLYRAHVLVCSGTGCTASKSPQIIEEMEREIASLGLDREVKVVQTGCFGLCAEGPIVVVYPEGVMYYRVQPADVSEIVSEHLEKGRYVRRLMTSQADLLSDQAKNIEESRFFAKQLRVALRNCGLINPESIDEYIAQDGYLALGRILSEKTPPMDVIDVIKKSGLRGRGGGGFPTGLKWEFAANQPSGQKYVCCNADEGDPGAFMDRSVLEGDPHSIVEAMAIAGYAIGANQGYAYVRAEYPIAVRRLQLAIDAARDLGLLGQNIFDSGFDFDIEIRLGAGAFVCGEETALMRSIEGKRGNPTPRPPFPAIKGLFGQPTILNNVETFANIPVILLQGAEWFSGLGTERSKGTKVFALGGKVNNVGLIEIPMGTTLREIVYDIGGGIPGGKALRLSRPVAPSGGCVPASELDTPVDYESLQQLGSIMGSGGMIVMDEDTCMVDIAKFFLEFTVDESCGKCAPCRIGTRRMLEILEKITDGRGQPEDLPELEHLATAIKEGSLCALGQTAPNPVLSTLKYFREEYEEHVTERRCRCHVCKNLLAYAIVAENCRKCGLCAKQCPADCISGVLGKEPYVIDSSRCIRCGACEQACKFNAVVRQ